MGHVIERAGAKDWHEVVDLLREFNDSLPPETSVDFDPRFFRDFFTRSLANGPLVLLFRGSGVLVADIAPSVFSHDLVASEKVWYIRPRDRSLAVATAMHRAFEEWAQEKKATMLFSNNVTGKGDGFYRRLGYSRSGAVWRKA